MESLVGNLTSETWCHTWFFNNWLNDTCDDVEPGFKDDVLLFQNYTAQLRYRQSFDEELEDPTQNSTDPIVPDEESKDDNSTDTDGSNSTDTEIDVDTNSTDIEDNNSTEIDANNSTDIEDNNSTDIDANETNWNETEWNETDWNETQWNETEWNETNWNETDN